MGFTPVGAKIFVVPDPRQETSRFGLHLPITAQEPVMTGTVAKVGPGHIGKDGKRVQMPVKEGDRVLFRGYYDPKRGSQFGGHYLVTRDELYAVLESGE